MRPLPAFVTVLLTAALAYYIYIPLPDAIQEPWRLMMLDAALRTAMSLVSWRQVSFCRCYTTALLSAAAAFVLVFIRVEFSKDAFWIFTPHS